MQPTDSANLPVLNPPLFVDLDGSLIATDLLAESLWKAVLAQPLAILKIPFWLLRGRAHLKRRLAELVAIDPTSLPYRNDVLQFIRTQKSQGRSIILATASDRLLADPVAEHLGEFEHLLASDGTTNLKGKAKLEAIQAYCHKNGHETFGYLGDGPADLAIWRSASEIYVVRPTSSLLRSIRKLREPDQVFLAGQGTWLPVLQALRPKQWTKNLLLFVPLITSHQLTNTWKAGQIALGFVAFSLIASSIYVLNDLHDLEADRQHLRKRHRPFADGSLPLAWGPVLGLGLFALGLTLALSCLPLGFSALLLIYVLLNVAYSFWLKSKVIVDVVLLSVFYGIRLIAGGLAANIRISEWLLAFSLFIFTSLAFAKRYSELDELKRSTSRDSAKGRGYVVNDIPLLANMGVSSGFLAVLVLALYISSDAVKALYREPQLLWVLCPLFLYWIGRLWLVVSRGELQEDPVDYAVGDLHSIMIAILAAIVLAIASIGIGWQ